MSDTNKMQVRIMATPGPDNVIILNGQTIHKVKNISIDAGVDRVTQVTFTILVDELTTLFPNNK